MDKVHFKRIYTNKYYSNGNNNFEETQINNKETHCGLERKNFGHSREWIITVLLSVMSSREKKEV